MLTESANKSSKFPVGMSSVVRVAAFAAGISVTLSSILSLMLFAGYRVDQTRDGAPRCGCSDVRRGCDGADLRTIDTITQQRDDVSAMLNLLQQRYQQLICRLQHQNGTGETGGWCDNHVHSGHATDLMLVSGLARLFFNQTVVGLGDGMGVYRHLLMKSGSVRRYDAFDGAPNINRTTGGQVGFIDLTLPQYWLPVYDWVLCLEVIEHIQRQFEHVVLANVARVAGTGAVISWARPDQRGFHHVNCRPPSYVIEAMARHGLREDRDWTRRLRSMALLPWLETNILVFRRDKSSLGWIDGRQRL